MTDNSYPCPACDGGVVSPTARPGRVGPYRWHKDIPIPADLVIPTCNLCGEEWVGAEECKALDDALRHGLDERLDGIARAFEARIRTEEREECARIVEETPFAEGTHTGTRQLDVKRRAAAAIRARGGRLVLPGATEVEPGLYVADESLTSFGQGPSAKKEPR